MMNAWLETSKVGRVTPCAPFVANQNALVGRRAARRGLTRPTMAVLCREVVHLVQYFSAPNYNRRDAKAAEKNRQLLFSAIFASLRFSELWCLVAALPRCALASWRLCVEKPGEMKAYL
jgi:hypothetical protein